MKLSIFTTVTTPELRGDNWKDALRCYGDLADEVVVVDGSADEPQKNDIKLGDVHVYRKWPKEFTWEFFGQQFQHGYEACTGDWVIKCDLDYIFHEEDFRNIRKSLERLADSPAVTFFKRQFILPDRYNVKSRLACAVNKAAYGDRIRFDAGGDLCQPSLDGVHLSSDNIPNLKIPFYNYEKLTKTKQQIMDDQGRMERAWFRHYGEYQMKSDGTDESAFDRWVETQIGKFNKPQMRIHIDRHPSYIRDTIMNLTPEQWGYSGFGYLEENDYVKAT